MNKAFAEKLQKAHKTAWLFLGMLLFKLGMEVGYLYSNIKLFRTDYPLDFHPVKYAAGLLWCIVLFANIRHTERKASSFFLYFIFLFQIVPITTAYALGNKSSAYYNVLCLGFLLCELIVGYTGERPLFRRNSFISRAMTLFLAAIAAVLVVYVILKNGAPHLSLLNIYTVYDYRTSGAFQAGKYMRYLLSWTAKVILPFGIAKSLVDRKYPAAAALCALQLLIYLYTGDKTYLLAIPFLLAGTLWARRKNFYQEIFLLGCTGFFTLAALSYPSREGSLPYRLFTLLGRRLFLMPGRLKFDYFDYFSTRPSLGIYGIFPRWIISVPSYYEAVDYANEIGVLYCNGTAETHANTGLFAEGFARFGHVGTILVLVLLALLLKQVDRFQERTSYQLAIGVFLYPIQFLGDTFLLSSLVFGPWTVLLMLLLFYRPQPSRNAKEALLREHPAIPSGPA